MLNIAAIAAIVATGALPGLTDAALSDASQSVMFAIDPRHMGDEPHLVTFVDACGLDEDRLHVLDQAIWTELAVREDARWARADAGRREAMAALDALPLAA